MSLRWVRNLTGVEFGENAIMGEGKEGWWRRLAYWEAGLVVGVVYMVAEDVAEVGEEFDG